MSGEQLALFQTSAWSLGFGAGIAFAGKMWRFCNKSTGSMPCNQIILTIRITVEIWIANINNRNGNLWLVHCSDAQWLSDIQMPGNAHYSCHDLNGGQFFPLFRTPFSRIIDLLMNEQMFMTWIPDKSVIHTPSVCEKLSGGGDGTFFAALFISRHLALSYHKFGVPKFFAGKIRKVWTHQYSNKIQIIFWHFLVAAIWLDFWKQNLTLSFGTHDL